MDKETFLKKNNWAKLYYATISLYDIPQTWSGLKSTIEHFLEENKLDDCKINVEEHYSGFECLTLSGERPLTEEEIEKRYQEALATERHKQKVYRENKKLREANEKREYQRLKVKYEI